MEDEAIVWSVQLADPGASTAATKEISLMMVVILVTFVVMNVSADTSLPVPQPGSLPVKVSPADREIF